MFVFERDVEVNNMLNVSLELCFRIAFTVMDKDVLDKLLTTYIRLSCIMPLILVTTLKEAQRSNSEGPKKVS